MYSSLVRVGKRYQRRSFKTILDILGFEKVKNYRSKTTTSMIIIIMVMYPYLNMHENCAIQYEYTYIVNDFEVVDEWIPSIYEIYSKVWIRKYKYG